MADVRALLKAKRQEARISHPLASYSQTGQLRCIACAISIKHSSAWEGHVGSKGHRTSVAKLKEEERVRAEQRRQREKEEQAKALADHAQQQEDSVGTKRKPVEAELDHNASKRARTEESGQPAGSFPMDFFSDPSKAPVLSQSDSEDEADQPNATLPSSNGAPNLDEEWALFQREIVNAPDLQETYERATVMAEPQVVTTPQGFPFQPDGPVAEEQEEPVVDEAEVQRRKEQDERELIMDRLLEEERAQEEADQKVVLMKSRIEALKKKRDAAKASKTKS
ncbi:hypothetical protein HGRIS_003676 [Hohenbuehelia grisea]|uniref:Coiled-coil domain-containing protein 16 n=1 Tax=Hohenbuehelia grisea TaxID=104357 RepID=A0ABR3JG70_9AGAR